MKSNGAMNGNGAPRGLRPEAAEAWAVYLSRWLGAFSRHGANVSMLTVQNEPGAPSPWEACYYDATQEARFIADYLGPALAAGVAAGRHPPVTLLGGDDQKDKIIEWSDTLLGDGGAGGSGGAAAYLGGMAYHWYAGSHFDRLARAVARHPGRMFLATEATYELTRLADAKAGRAARARWLLEGEWSRGEGYGEAILGDLLAGSAGWIDWNLLLDARGGPNHLGNMCDAPMIADEAYETVHLHPQFWYLGHFAKFVPPGAVRIGLETSASLRGHPVPVDSRGAEDDTAATYNFTAAVAYGRCPPGPPRAVALRRPDAALVVIVLNCDEHAATVRIELPQSGAPAAALERSIPPHASQTYLLHA